MEIRQAVKNYLEWKAVRSPKAAITYKLHITRFAEYKCKDTKELTNHDIVEFNQALATKYNPPTVAYSCRVLKNFFNYLNALREASISTFFIQAPKYMKKIRVGVSDEEFAAMCATLNPYELGDLQKLSILHMLHDTGMRVGELCDLNVNQISSTESYTS